MSKYSGLPDIDTAPDVYESNPGATRAEDAYESASDDEVAAPGDEVERASLDPKAAQAHFRRGAPVVHEGTETPLARLLRLQDEARALEEALAAEPERSEHRGALQLLERIERLAQQREDRMPPLDAPATVALIHTLGKTQAQGPTKDDAAPPSELALRLAELEQCIGPVDGAEDIVPLTTTLARLESQIQLLAQPRHLDAIVHRAKLASSELERLAESRKRMAQHEDVSSETLAKVSELHALQTRIEPLIPLAPALLARLEALAPLHASASDAASRVASIEQAQGSQKSRVAELRTMLSEAEASLAANVEVTQTNLAALQARLARLEQQATDTARP